MQRIRIALALLAAVIVSVGAPNMAASASVSHVENDGVRIAYEVVGEGAPLVLIPGFTQSRQAWKAAGYVDAFARRGRQLILIDPRGHGDSDKPHDPSAYRPELLAADVIAVLDRLGIRRADLFGYSRGGAIAIATAITHPQRVRSVVLGGSHPFAEDMGPFRAAIGSGLENWISILEANAGQLPDGAKAMFLANDVEALKAAVADDRPDLSSQLAKSGVPAFLYAGSEDPRADAAKRFATATGGQYLELPELNHFQAFFALQPVVDAVETFQSSLVGT